MPSSTRAHEDFGSYGAKPHVVMLLTDDMGWDLFPPTRELSAEDATQGKRLLPAMTRWLRREGFLLERHYAAELCAPSRRSLMSGRWPINANYDGSQCSGLPLTMTTLADHMKAAGYTTHFVGKWHLGFAVPAATPCRRGFDTALGFFHKAVHHFTLCSRFRPEQAAGWCTSTKASRDTPIYDFFVGSSGVDRGVGTAHPAVANRTYDTELFANEAVRRIREHRLVRRVTVPKLRS